MLCQSIESMGLQKIPNISGINDSSHGKIDMFQGQKMVIMVKIVSIYEAGEFFLNICQIFRHIDTKYTKINQMQQILHKYSDKKLPIFWTLHTSISVWHSSRYYTAQLTRNHPCHPSRPSFPRMHPDTLQHGPYCKHLCINKQ